jgi:hypothetical protein
MRHKIEVDQSIKTEEAGPTVVAFANGITHAILVPSKAKQAALRALQARGKTKNVAHMMLWAACLYLLLRDHVDVIDRVVIDMEYTGQEAMIRDFLLAHIWRMIPDFPSERIVFMQVGKKSPAHRKANAVRERRDKDFRTVATQELVQLLQ